jgi:hypothetical protein
MLNSFIHRTFLAITMLLPVSNAMSKDFSFDYVQANFTVTTVDLGASIDEVEGNGFGFSLSLSINPHLAFTLAVMSTTFRSFQGIDVDTSKSSTLGATAHTSIASATDIFANLSAVKAEVEANDGVNSMSDSDIGSVFSIGLRHLVTDRIELELAAANQNVFDKETFSYSLDTRFYFRKQFSVAMGIISSDNANSFLLNIRMDI